MALASPNSKACLQANITRVHRGVLAVHTLPVFLALLCLARFLFAVPLLRAFLHNI